MTLKTVKKLAKRAAKKKAITKTPSPKKKAAPKRPPKKAVEVVAARARVVAAIAAPDQPTRTVPAPGHVLVLRACRDDLSSSHGFTWPKSGPVAAHDWMPTKECGNGLHGWLWGEGDASIAGHLDPFTANALWLVVEVDASLVVDLGGKVKFPCGEVVFCGARDEATKYLAEHGGAGKAIISGTATAGDAGTATAGEKGGLVLRIWDGVAGRYRMLVAYVGEDGILPGVAYKATEDGKSLVPVDEAVRAKLAEQAKNTISFTLTVAAPLAEF